jgi:hypothetical protein
MIYSVLAVWIGCSDPWFDYLELLLVDMCVVFPAACMITVVGEIF